MDFSKFNFFLIFSMCRYSFDKLYIAGIEEHVQHSGHFVMISKFSPKFRFFAYNDEYVHQYYKRSELKMSAEVFNPRKKAKSCTV